MKSTAPLKSLTAPNNVVGQALGRNKETKKPMKSWAFLLSLAETESPILMQYDTVRHT